MTLQNATNITKEIHQCACQLFDQLCLWSSNLVAKKGETGSLTLNFKNGALETKSQANLINK